MDLVFLVSKGIISLSLFSSKAHTTMPPVTICFSSCDTKGQEGY